MTLAEYITAVDGLYRSGRATEHSYRSDLQRLLTGLCSGITVTNEPQRIACGAPDYILTRRDIPIGYIEAKDVTVDLGSKGLKEQFDRYRKALDNLVFTDYLEFRFFRNGEATATVRIGEVSGGRIKPLPGEYDRFKALFTDFCAWHGQTITSPKKLAGMMAAKARLLADVIERAVSSDEETRANTDLKEQLEAFKNILIHDITPKGFADLYAQTIAYGMFAARLHDPTLDTFSRMEAATLIPKSNPFLRKLFNSISGADLDDRIVWIVDALADIFRATDISKLLSGFGRSSGREDAFLHFYEDFLAAYDPKLRKSRGVWYTPDAVVRFIVRAVDDILRTEFGLPMGLADSTKVRIKRKAVTKGKHRDAKVKDVYVEEEVHRVQVLDPATGTGTFLAEVVRQVHDKFQGQEGMWPQYVEQHLIPRLNGFELLMASYAMAHLKLDLVLRETGYDMGKPHNTPNARAGTDQQRLRVFLTNSLEEAHPDTGTLFASWLSQEANEANAVKRDTPVMVVLGNPPYALSSANKGDWIAKLVNDYKIGIDEQNLNALGDDYVKFVRYSQHLIDKTGEGIMAIISNNSFIDGITQRGMRASLLSSFNRLYILDLHGSMKRRERSPDGTKDQNVFDIQQGVSISLFIKNPRHRGKPIVLHSDVYGDREQKYSVLARNSLDQLDWKEVQPVSPQWFLVPKDMHGANVYSRGLRIDSIFTLNGNGIKFRKDNLLVKNHFNKDSVRRMLSDVCNLSDTEVYALYDTKPTPDWDLSDKRRWFISNDEENIVGVQYRQFDRRWTYYPLDRINQIIVRGDSRHGLMRHYTIERNIGLIVGRQGQVVGDMPWNLAFITAEASDMNIFYRGGGISFPLYLYPDTTKQTAALSQDIQPNLDVKLVGQLAESIGLSYRFDTNDLWAHGIGKDITPLDVLDYCYAVLHSPAYREKYKEFLKSDFPRIPYPNDATKFRALVQLGARLRKLHLLEDP